jgi:hypothetical protein
MEAVDTFGAILAAGSIGWLGWVSVKLNNIDVHTAKISTTLADHEERLAELERLFPRHVVHDDR